MKDQAQINVKLDTVISMLVSLGAELPSEQTATPDVPAAPSATDLPTAASSTEDNTGAPQWTVEELRAMMEDSDMERPFNRKLPTRKTKLHIQYEKAKKEGNQDVIVAALQAYRSAELKKLEKHLKDLDKQIDATSFNDANYEGLVLEQQMVIVEIRDMTSLGSEFENGTAEAETETADVPTPPSATPPPPPAPAEEKVETKTEMVMTEKAQGATYESMVKVGWKDADLIAQGYAVEQVVEVKGTTPPPPPAPAEEVAAPKTKATKPKPEIMYVETRVFDLEKSQGNSEEVMINAGWTLENLEAHGYYKFESTPVMILENYGGVDLTCDNQLYDWALSTFLDNTSIPSEKMDAIGELITELSDGTGLIVDVAEAKRLDMANEITNILSV